ncbi:MAG: DUF4388 domain-containing protein [Acidobacteriota bacterium]
MSSPSHCGHLEDTGLPALLASICGAHQTGVLRLTRLEVCKTIYIQDGNIIFATSNNPDDRLGELLLRKGLLRIQHFEEASTRLSDRRRLGAVLVEMGHLRPEELVRAVIEQVKEIIFDIFLWFDGEYTFVPGALPSREVITLKLSTPEVILGGIQRIPRWSRVLQGVGGLEAAYRACGGRDRILQQMTLRTEHAALLQTLEEPMSVRDLCRRGLLADFEVCKALWAFRVIGLVEPAFTAAPEVAQAQAVPASLPPQPPAPEPAQVQAAAAMTMAIPALEPEASAPAPAPSAPGDEEPSLEVVEVKADAPAAPANQTPPAVPAPSAPVSSPAPGSGARESDGPAASQASVLDEKQLESSLASFNERHRRFYAALLPRAGEKSLELVQRCLAMIDKDLPGLFNGATPDAEGVFDPEALKTNIFAFGVVGYAAGLDMLIEREIELASTLYGPEVRREISSALKALQV